MAGPFQSRAISHLILPTLTKGERHRDPGLGDPTITRNMMVEVLSEDYIRTGCWFAYGLPRSIYYQPCPEEDLNPDVDGNRQDLWLSVGRRW